MKKRHSLIYISLIAVISLFSCRKYLDKKSDTSLVVPTSLSDLQALLDNAGNMNFNTPTTGEASSDDYMLLQSDYEGMHSNYQKLYTWQPYDVTYPNDWSYSYNAVYYTNLVLERLGKIPFNNAIADEWNNVKGSALFYRAYCFLNLAWIYTKAFDETTAATDLGLVLRKETDFNVKSKRASVLETYQQIITDATEAATLLPSISAHVFRPSKAAAYGLLARTYLSMRKYEDALKYADMALDIKDDLLNYNDQALVDSLSDYPFANIPLGANPEIVFYSEQNGLNFTYATNVAKIPPSLLSSYDDNDIRKSVFFGPDYMGNNDFKYTGSYTTFDWTFFSGIATDELYLIRAECYARAGNKDAALGDLNTLLSNRWTEGTFTPVTAANAAEALEIILQERRKELIFRGLRWIDIKRLNKEGRNIILTRDLGNGQTKELPVNSGMFAYPIPSDIIKLTGIDQN